MYSKDIVWKKTKQNKNPQQANMFIIYIKDDVSVSKLHKEFLEAKRNRKYTRISGKKLQQFCT